MVTTTAPADTDAAAAAKLPGAPEQEEEEEEKEEQQQQQEHEHEEETEKEESTAAEEKASDAIGTVALEDLERQYFLCLTERESLQRRLGETESERNTLIEQVTKLHEKNQQRIVEQHAAEVWSEKLATVERHYADATDRNDRMQLEQDRLREEISQLNAKNTDLTKQLASEQIKSKLQESEAIPLFHEKERLQTELDAVQAHAWWLQQELEAKQKDSQHVQTQSRDRTLQLQLQLSHTSDELAEAQTKLSILETAEHDLQNKLSQLTKDHMDLKLELQATAAASAQDLHDKQHIVDLQKEHIARWKKRCQDVEQDNEELRQTAQKALEAGDREIEQVKNEVKTQCLALMQEQKAHYESQLQQQRAQIAANGSNQNLIVAFGGSAAVDRAKEDGEEDNGPFEMTDLLQRWEDAKRALRTERWNHDRTKRNFNKLVKEIRDKTPQMARQREEFEMAVDRNEELEKRLKSAMQEKEFALADVKDAQKEMTRLANKLKRREEEAKTLALQVQALLIKQSGGEPSGDIALSVPAIQTQNMQLLEEHRRLTQLVEDLEGRLKSDTLRAELDSKSNEVARLVAERGRQERLVEQIVQQRDLYRALVNRHDNVALGTGSDDFSMSDTVQKQSVKLQSLEKSNRALEEKLLIVTNELDNTTRAKETFQERFKRYELANADLTSSVDDLQKKLLAANGSSARNAADAEYHKEKCSRLEESLERSRGEIIQLNQRRTEMDKNFADLEGVLSKETAERGRLESEKRTYESKLRSVETRLETEKATVERYARDNGQLRDDIARQGAMIDHIRRIENSITTKNESEMGQLKEQLSFAQEKIETLERIHSSESTEMSNKLADSQSKIDSLQANLTKHQEEGIEAKQEWLEAKTELQIVKSQVRKLDGQLRAAKKKLGEETDDENVELELQQKIDHLESELGKAKAEIVALQEEVESYRSLAKSGEKELSKTKTAAENFKAELQEEVNDLKRQVDQRNKEFESRSDLLKDLTSDLASQRGEREKIEQALKAEIQSLKDKIASDAALVSSTKDSFDVYKADIERYRKDVSEAQQNYERELAKHAEARTALRTAQETAVEHQRIREEAESKLQTVQREFESEKQTFVVERDNLSSQIATLEKRVEDSRDQNKLLHSQLESLNSSIEKSKGSTEVRGDEENPESEQQRLAGESREIIKLLRADNDVCQADLDAARRALDREKAATEVLRRSLEEARSELRSAQQPVTADSSVASEDIRRQLDDKTHQLRVMNDSNRVLREDAERLTQKLKKVDKDLAAAKTTMQPVEDIKRELGNQIKQLEAENGSLRRELDSWKSRMNSLVKNLDQVDPEEHRKLVAQIAEMTKEQESLNAWKATMEAENQRIRAIATSQKKIKDGYQATIAEQKKEIASLQQEKQNLTSNVSTATKALTKERDDLKTKVLQIEKENASLKTEVEGATTNSNRLRDQMRKMKDRITLLEQELAKLQEAAKLMEASATAAAAATPAAPEPSATSAQQSAEVTSAISLDIPKIPSGGFRFGPSVFQSRSEPLNKNPSASSSSDGQVEKTQFLKPTPDESVVQENKETTFKEKLKRKKLEQQRELENAMKRKRDAEVEALKRAKKSDHETPLVESTVLTAESDEPEDKSSKDVTTEVTTAAEAAPAPDESTTYVEKTGDTAAATEKGSAGEHLVLGATPIIGVPAFGQCQALRPTAMPFVTSSQSQPTPSFGASASASSLGSVATSKPFAKNSSSGGGEGTTTNNPFAKASGEGATVNPFAKISSGEATSAVNPFAKISSSGDATSAVNPFTNSSSGEAGSSTFLNNMKAPGSSGSIPSFSFGLKANITLPTPTLTTPAAPSPFGTSSEFRRSSSSMPSPGKPLFSTSSSNNSLPTAEETIMTEMKTVDEEEGQMEDMDEGESKP